MKTEHTTFDRVLPRAWLRSNWWFTLLSCELWCFEWRKWRLFSFSSLPLPPCVIAVRAIITGAAHALTSLSTSLRSDIYHWCCGGPTEYRSGHDSMSEMRCALQINSLFPYLDRQLILSFSVSLRTTNFANFECALINLLRFYALKLKL